jgi:hypothetical protein
MNNRVVNSMCKRIAPVRDISAVKHAAGWSALRVRVPMDMNAEQLLCLVQLLPAQARVAATLEPGCDV